LEGNAIQKGHSALSIKLNEMKLKMKKLFIYKFNIDNEQDDIDWVWAENEDMADALFQDIVKEFDPENEHVVVIDECYEVPIPKEVQDDLRSKA